FRFANKVVDVSRIEGKHIVVTGDYTACSDRLPQSHGFPAIEISGNPARRIIAIDGQDGYVERPCAKQVRELVEPKCIAAVINMIVTEGYYIAHESTIAVFIAFNFVVLRGDAVKSKVPDPNTFSVIESRRKINWYGGSVGCKFTVGFRDNERRISIVPEHRDQGIRVQVIGVVMARRDYVYPSQEFRINNTLAHANVWLVGMLVLSRERIGEVRIDEDTLSFPL